jgi:large subunit ribosomal protein L15
MKLNELFDLPGSKRTRKRVGRGIGSGKGKTCGSGVKGQKARAGVAIKGFEGGQMPLIARLPKRGFNCPSSHSFSVINFTTLTELSAAKKIKAGQKIDKETLVKAGVIKNTNLQVKLLSKGHLAEKFDFSLDAYSQSAKDAIEKVGGKIL